jgi:AbiV family abortive infection protein
MTGRGEKLDRDQLIEVSLKSLRNGGNLASGAERCLTAGSGSTAFPLAVLAAEELGKIVLCAEAIEHLDEDSDSVFWRQFLDRFRTHGEKHLKALTAIFGSLLEVAKGRRVLGTGERTGELMSFLTKNLDELQEIVDSMPSFSRSMIEEKLKALYVDVIDGVVCAPDEVVDRDSAQEVILSSNSALGTSSASWNQSWKRSPISLDPERYDADRRPSRSAALPSTWGRTEYAEWRCFCGRHWFLSWFRMPDGSMAGPSWILEGS